MACGLASDGPGSWIVAHSLASRARQHGGSIGFFFHARRPRPWPLYKKVALPPCAPCGGQSADLVVWAFCRWLAERLVAGGGDCRLAGCRATAHGGYFEPRLVRGDRCGGGLDLVSGSWESHGR